MSKFRASRLRRITPLTRVGRLGVSSGRTVTSVTLRPSSVTLDAQTFTEPSVTDAEDAGRKTMLGPAAFVPCWEIVWEG